MPNKACCSLEQSILPSDGCPSPLVGSAVRFYPVMCQTRRDGWVNVAMSSIFGLIGVVVLCGVHLLLLFLHGTSGQLFPSAEHRGCPPGKYAPLEPVPGSIQVPETLTTWGCQSMSYALTSLTSVQSWRGGTRNRRSWGDIQECIFLVHDRHILGSTPTLAMSNCGM